MNRFLEEHKVNQTNNQLTIEVTDAPGSGGANHRYEITGLDLLRNASYRGFNSEQETRLVLLFQNGGIRESGVNGVTHEALLEIVADRLRSFQKGSYACKANACALTHIEEAQHWLQQRTLERMRRRVEGTLGL